MTPDRFIDYFRARHGWRCREGSAIYKDLSSFAADQSASPHGVEDLYVLFCVAHAIRPKDAMPAPMDGKP
ncbi:UNVERIFIED_ORG: hypothetical protein LHK14_18130 [Roseateles sp. XES5]|nr:hypothetical protein [Roseateles sp. XES5]